MKKAQDILDLFSQDLDGESFDSDADALREINISYRNLLGERDWHILKKSYTLPAGTTLLSAITDLDKVLKVWENGNELKKTNFDNRFDTNYDYWIDHANGTINFINYTVWATDLIIDYKYAPDDLANMEDEIVFPDVAYPIISYDMILAFKEKDTDPDFYDKVEIKKEKALNNTINWNENLYAQE